MKYEYLKLSIYCGLTCSAGIFTTGLMTCQLLIYPLIMISIISAIVIASLCFYMNIYISRNMRLKVNAIEIELNSNENIFVEGIAGHNSNKHDVGKLVITNNSLMFRSLSSRQWCYSLSGISNISLTKKWGIIPRGLQFVYKGSEEHYLVDYPEDWKIIIEYIKSFNSQSC